MPNLLGETSGMMAFVRTVEAGSFSAAARALNTTPSAVSKSVAKLEKRLGTRLFLRSTRALKLTQDGQSFFDRVAPLLKQLDSSDDALTEQTEPSGRLRISMPHDMAALVLPSLFGRFAQTHPQLDLDIGLTDRYVDLIREDYDVVLRVGEPAEKDLMVRSLAVLPTVLVASPSFIDRSGMPDSVEALRTLPFVRYSRNGQLSSLTSQDGVSFTPSGRVNADSGAALIHAASEGLGIAWLLRCLVAEELRSGKLVELTPPMPLPKASFNALHAFGFTVPTRVRLFCDYMAKEAKSLAEM
ncbi:MAG: LysR family transcriptional regulator [Rhodobacteraceae bacterium]|nr:LysR family transcriptional regulator [Paracoccaceae bacterium]